MIRLENFSISNNNGQVLLKDLNLFVPTGSIISIAGKQGYGKSRLLKTIGLIDRPASGNIYLLGKNINKLNRSEISNIHKEIGIVYQENNFFDEFDVEFNIKFPLILKKEKKKDINFALNELLPWLSLERIVKKKISQLSYSEKKLVQFARAIIGRPRILLLDEFFPNIEVKIENKINYLMQALNRIGTSILIFGSLSGESKIKFDKRYTINNKGLVQTES